MHRVKKIIIKKKIGPPFIFIGAILDFEVDVKVVVVPDVIARSVLKLQRSYTPLWIQESLSYSLVYAIFV